ncbi:MAG TPA: metalloregulator ArsR/SmtB family transcription factor, partial [Candidatus Kapabacteria bacterium]|nr:metalloregulator ArsR/SmtB family transcription factor [Candidatus Kapabacteria bacterium]
MTTATVPLIREAQRLEKAAEILKTIAHPVRLEVLNMLETYRELSVSDIQEKLSITIEQSMLSHHLIKMKDKGILTSQKNGVSVVYRLAEPNI